MTMPTLRVKDVLNDKILVSRESARALAQPLRAMMEIPERGSATEASPLTVDFEGVEGMAPSFLDELLTLFDALLATAAGNADRTLTVANPPARLSRKFEAAARGHGLSVRLLPDGSWAIVDAG